MKRIIPILICLPLMGCYETSQGEFIGQITWFTKRGIFCKTYEGQAILGGTRKQTNISSDGKSTVTSSIANTTLFTVEDLTLIPKIQAAFESGKTVRLKYRVELVTFCRSDGNDTFVYDIADDR